MAADGQLLQGEITEDPAADEKDVERLLAGFLRALLDEQKGEQALGALAHPSLKGGNA